MKEKNKSLIPKTVNTKTFMATILTLTIVVAFTLNYALSASTVTIVPASFIDAYAYTVWGESGTYYAKNGVGEVDYSGTNAVTVITSAWNNFQFGTIYLKDCIIITETLTLALDTHNSRSLVFDTIRVDANVDGVVIEGGTGNHLWYGELRGINIYWNVADYDKTLLTIKNVIYGTVDIGALAFEAELATTGSVGLELLGEGHGCYFNTVTVNRIAGLNTSLLLNASGSYPTAFVNANYFHDITMIYVGSYGMRTSTAGGDISGNYFYDLTVNGIDTGETGFYFGGTPNAICHNNLIGCSTIDVLGTAVDVHVAANYAITLLQGQFAHGNMVNNGILEIYHVQGFVTENSGTAEFADNSSTTFDHLLAGTPTFVSCSFNDTATGAYKWTATSMNITVTVAVSGNYTVYWSAKYKP